MVAQTKAHPPVWKYVQTIIKFRWKFYIFNLLALMIMLLSRLMPGLVLRDYFNLLNEPNAAPWGVAALMAFMAVSAVTHMGSFWGMGQFNRRFNIHVQSLLQKNMLDKVLSRPGADALSESPGETISRFRGDVAELPFFAMWINDFIGNFLITIVAVAIMISINARLTIIALLPLILIIAFTNMAAGRAHKYRMETRKRSGIVIGFIAETFNAVQAVKVSTAEDRVIDYFDDLNEKRRQAALKDRLFNETLRSVFINSSNISTAIILILATTYISAGSFSIGDFALFVSFLGSVAGLLGLIGFMIARYKQAGVAVERMERVMQGDGELELVSPSEVYMDSKAPAIPFIAKNDADYLYALTAEGLTFIHPESGRGIENISLHLQKGSFTVITGRIGSGKTTLLRTLIGLLPKQAGEVLWNGHIITSPSEFFIPPRIAYTAQVPRLFSDSLRQNLLMGLPEKQVDLEAAIAAAVMEQDLQELEAGLDTMVGPKGVKLSGGQVQRSATARMFARDAELYLFDDLSSALDVETEKLLWNRLFSKKNVPTCLVVSHRRAALCHADHIVVLKNGHVHASGNLSTLLTTNEEMRRLWEGDLQ